KTELMPNPVSTNLYILSESAIAQLQVFDIYGRLLKTLTPNAKQAIVNVRQLKNGVYTIKIKTEGGIITKRFVVRH
ncbi:MAG: T9SS type A sorting domain-containing protein, partial [Bacteroidales bacterium]|nr:T9SS type A sorting domain-containing protein [Bacteroidales bacterium]